MSALDDAWYFGVFDGHAGWQVSDHCGRKLHQYLDKHLEGASSEAQIKTAIIKAFAQVEQEWLEFASSGFHYGFMDTASVGSCALIAVKIKDKLFVANCGDSKAVILRQTDNTFTAIDASKTFNANKDYEQKRL